MSALNSLGEFVASYCPPIGKPLHYGQIQVVDLTGTEAGSSRGLSGRNMLFVSDGQGRDGNPSMAMFLMPLQPLKAKMGGRIDTANGHYVIIGGGKSEAKRLVALLQG